MRKIVSITALIICITMLIGMLSSCNNNEKKDINDNTVYTVEMKVKNFGTMKLELYSDIAPISVNNFIKYVKKGFYDGLTFHRIVDGFMIQGGDPTGTGYGDSKLGNIKGEFWSNGWSKNLCLPFEEGVIGMARSKAADSGSSQFFICLDDYESGYGDYASFGKVIEGLDVLHAIGSVKCKSNGLDEVSVPVETVYIDSVKVISEREGYYLAPIDESSDNVYTVEMKVKDFGTMKLKLYGDIAPISVNNFIKYVNEGFYDGLTFHRIMDGFMIQGGDPTGTGYGDASLENIKGEFAANGWYNNLVLPFEKGVIGMARGNNPDSGASQFFICLDDYNSGNGLYASFGKLTEGLDVLEKIGKVKCQYNGDELSKPINDVYIESVRVISGD